MRKQILKERAEKGKRVVEAWPKTSGVQGVKCRHGQYECQNKAKDLVLPAKASVKIFRQGRMRVHERLKVRL